MQSQTVLRFLVGAIVAILAVVLLGVIAKVGGVLLSLALKLVLVLLLVAVVVRFMSLIDERRRPF
jgi:hypothetical protein